MFFVFVCVGGGDGKMYFVFFVVWRVPIVTCRPNRVSVGDLFVLSVRGKSLEVWSSQFQCIE